MLTVTSELPELPPEAFAKQDMGDDFAFYVPPRFVTHIDEAAVAALTNHYRHLVLAGGVVLDLMSSWVSHLPNEIAYVQVIGHGMNANELAANPHLDRWFVQDLNRESRLPLDDASLDAALCCVGVQYLQRPVAVFAEVRRALKPHTPFIVSFSNRCFPTKATAVWLSLDTQGHAALVELYLERAGFSEIVVEVLRDCKAGDPLVAVAGRA